MSAAGIADNGRHSRVAVLSDIHGVLPALEAVLAEPALADAERIVLTGDILAGPQPLAVARRLEQLGERAVWIRGNCERLMVAHRRGEARAPVERLAWCAEQLDETMVDRLSALPLTAELAVRGLGRVLFCHATPRDDEEVAVVDSAPRRWEEILAGVDPGVTTVVCGHTHMPFLRLAAGRTVVNPGSVGRPYGPAGACWALLGPGVELRRTVLDEAAVAEATAAAQGFPDAAQWLVPALWGHLDATEALRRQGALDGRDVEA
jgi:predicted phosphodiesterase